MSDIHNHDEPLFEWLKKFQHQMPKNSDYAKKRLESYRLGINARGAVKGIMIEVDDHCCEQARTVFPGKFYQPDNAPHIPLDDCPVAEKCRCVYRPLMNYQAPNLS